MAGVLQSTKPKVGCDSGSGDESTVNHSEADDKIRWMRELKQRFDSSFMSADRILNGLTDSAAVTEIWSKMESMSSAFSLLMHHKVTGSASDSDLISRLRNELSDKCKEVDILRQELKQVTQVDQKADKETGEAAHVLAPVVSQPQDSDRRDKRSASRHGAKDEKKKRDRMHSPTDEQQPTSSTSASRKLVSKSVVGSKVTRVETQANTGRRSPSPAHTHSPCHSLQSHGMDSAAGDYLVVDDIHNNNSANGNNGHNHSPRSPSPVARMTGSPVPYCDDHRPPRIQRPDNRGSGPRVARSSRSPAAPPSSSSIPGLRHSDSGRRPRTRSRSPSRRSSPGPPFNRRPTNTGPVSGRIARSRSPNRPFVPPVHALNRLELPVNIYRFTAIRIRNIYPLVNEQLLAQVASVYGRVVQIEKKDRECIITFSDTEAPRKAIAEMHDTVVKRVSNFNDPLHVRFALGSNQDKFHMRNVKRIESDECHFFRTTGCEDPDCPERHVDFNAGIDLQPWMGKRVATGTPHAPHVR